MSLTIHVVDRQADWPRSAPRLSFEDGGAYWFCYPYFHKLYEATGQDIDLYGAAWFRGDDLTHLEGCLREIWATAAGQPDAWEQSVGDVAHEPGASKPVTDTVSRQAMLDLIAQFLGAVADARHAGTGIACAGD